MDKEKEKILIIKTGYSEILHLDSKNHSRDVSFGDILRTTPLLHLYKNDDVTWVTDEKAFPLLEGNPYINRLLPFDWITSEQLKKERFDILINLEKTPGVCVISDSIYSRKRFGFTFDPEKRKAEAYDKSYEVLAVSSDIQAKKNNLKTAQELLFEMVGSKWQGEEYILGYIPKTQEIYDIGLNTIIGKKWPTKIWPSQNWDKLKTLLENSNLKVSRQDEQHPEILRNLYKYIDWINSCKLIISSDSLGMHLAIALKKKVLGLFGPTPYKEAHFYNKGKVILPEPIPDCMPCFEGACSRGKTCMTEISPEKVHEEIEKLINL